MPTDTLYGIVAAARNKEAVERVYRIRKRSPEKPSIILIASLADLSLFSIRLSVRMKHLVSRFWPGPVSIILPCTAQKYSYLHRGTKTLAIRLPNSQPLRALIVQTGPLIAPSANPEGEPPATTSARARKYFGSSVDCYVDGGKKESAPSSIIGMRGNSITVIRDSGSLSLTL